MPNKSHSENPTTVVNSEEIVKCILYKRRFLVLFLFCLFTIANILQWIEYPVITEVLVTYYGISYTAAEWSSLIFMLVYIPASIPGFYIIDRLGLRNSVLIGIVITSIGAWIKVGSVHPDRYWVVLLGQAVVSMGNVFVLPLPPKVATAWFGANEVSKACSVALIATQVATAIGFLIPPLIVTVGDQDDMEFGLYTLALVVAVFSTVLIPVIFFFFQNAPPTAPSLAQLKIQENRTKESKSFMQNLTTLMKNRSYVLLFFIYGINAGMYYALNILLSQIILSHYPDAFQDVGTIGLVMILIGIFGSVSCGIVLDKFHRYKATTYIFHFTYFLAAVAFSIFIGYGLAVVYIITIILGFFFNGVLTVGFELGVELTYPGSEGLMSGILVTASQAFGIGLTYLYSYLFRDISEMWANITMCIILAIVEFLIFFIRFDLKRYSVQLQSKTKSNIV